MTVDQRNKFVAALRQAADMLELMDTQAVTPSKQSWKLIKLDTPQASLGIRLR